MNATSGNHSRVYATEAPSDGVALIPQFLRIEDVAAVLRLSTREIYRLIESGDLVVREYGRRKLVEPDSVTQLAEKIRNGDFAAAVAA